MSFSIDVKTELLGNPQENDCCALSFLSAVIHTAGSVNISRKGLYAEISSENGGLIKEISGLFKRFFNISAEIFSEKKNSLKKHTLYTLYTPEKASEQILCDLGIIGFDENRHRQIIRGIDAYLVENDCCAVSYLKGAFLSCGSITVPVSDGQMGYHMEFALSNRDMAEGILRLLERFGVCGKFSKRKGDYVVYIKESDGISDFLALLKANRAVLEIQGIKVEREVKNNANRQTNCILANIDKTVGAAVKQAEAINLIEKKIGLGNLPPKLQTVARLRQEYPDVSLEAIADLSGEKLTKSGINHRMRRIMNIAKELNETENI